MVETENSGLKTFPRKLLFLWAALLGLGFVGRLLYGYEVDELMHLHSAWCIGQGQLPYRDFYDNHLPVWHALVSPVVGTFTHANLLVLIETRVVALAILVFLLVCFYRVCRAISPAAAPLAVGALILIHPFETAGFELRPDWLAMVCILASLLILQSSIPKRPGHVIDYSVIAGVLQGIAIGITQKSFFLVFAAVIWLIGTCHFADSREERRQRLFKLIATVVGICIPIAILIAWYARHNATKDLLEYGILQNLRWMREDDILSGAQESVLANFPIFAFAFIRLIQALGKAKQHLKAATMESLMLFLLVAGSLAYLKTPVPISQWFLFMVVPWAACIGAIAMFDFAGSPELFKQDKKSVIIGCVIAILALKWYNMLIAGIGWGIILTLVWRKVRTYAEPGPRISAAFKVAFGIGIAVFAGRLVDEFGHLYVFKQIEAIHDVENHLPNNAAILAPWPNLAPFHPSASFHTFAIGGIYTVMSMETLQDEYIEALKSGKSKLVVFRPIDVEQKLPRFSKYVRQHGTLLRSDKINLRVVETYVIDK